MLFAIRQAVELVQRRASSLRIIAASQVRKRTVPRLEALEDRWVPTQVMNLNDAGAGSLRQAILDANANGAATITFAPGLSGDINLASPLPTFNVNIFIGNSAGNPIAVVGNGTFELFATSAQTQDEIDNLEMDQGGGVVGGGGIYNRGSLTLNGCYMRLCSASAQGGAIFNADGAALSLLNTSLFENAALDGGAICNKGGRVNIYSGTVIESNNATEDGGGIWSDGTFVISNNVVVNDNHAARYGGGIFNGGYLSMGASSLTSNGADDTGGGLYTSVGTAELTGTSIQNNSAANKGGGFYLLSGSLALDSCTLSGNTAPLGNGGAYHKPATPTLQGQMVIINQSIVPDN